MGVPDVVCRSPIDVLGQRDLQQVAMRDDEGAFAALTNPVKLQAQGRPTRVLRNLPRQGLAQQRQFLLDASEAELVLYLDDDVWLEPRVLTRMADALQRLDCGFVGSAVQGLSCLDDVRGPEQQPFEWWEGLVRPEEITRDSPEFERWMLHNAANLAHIAADADIPEGGWKAYRIAWVGGCCLFRRSALVESGGFGFWTELPPDHAGEDVVAQWRVMRRFGGAGILPSGAVHLESPTTIVNRDVEASAVITDDRRPSPTSDDSPPGISREPG